MLELGRRDNELKKKKKKVVNKNPEYTHLDMNEL